MDIHQLKLLDFEEAFELLENRLVDIRRLIEDNKSHAPQAVMAELETSGAEAAANLARLRAMKASEMSGEQDNLLSEVAALLDQIGQKVSDLFPDS